MPEGFHNWQYIPVRGIRLSTCVGIIELSTLKLDDAIFREHIDSRLIGDIEVQMLFRKVFLVMFLKCRCYYTSSSILNLGSNLIGCSA